MNFSVQFSAEIEQALKRHAAQAGIDIPTFVQRIVTEQLTEESLPVPANDQSYEAFEKRFDAWIARHPVLDHEIDDSRESIYEGCGE